jgi:hypothetical protein
LVEAGAQRFAQAASNPIAHHRLADATAHRDANARAVEVIRGDEQDEERVGPAALRLIANAAELCRRPEPLLGLHGASRWRWALLNLDDGEALAAAQTSALEHRTACRRQHALEEAVLPPTRDAFRLVGTLGHGA